MSKRMICGFLVAMPAIALWPGDGYGHGSMMTPPSRIYHCRFNDNVENPQDPACAAAVQVNGTQPFYDWNGLRQGNANSQHQAIIPDGQLCSGGNSFYVGMDLPRGDWHSTPIEPDAQGQFEFLYVATAPHQTLDMLFYITRDGWQPTGELAWGDVDLFCQHGNVPLQPLGNGQQGYRMSCDLPERSGTHTIFHIWQRSDSPEAFYACVDVAFGGGNDVIFGDGFETT